MEKKLSDFNKLSIFEKSPETFSCRNIPLPGIGDDLIHEGFGILLLGLGCPNHYHECIQDKYSFFHGENCFITW